MANEFVARANKSHGSCSSLAQDNNSTLSCCSLLFCPRRNWLLWDANGPTQYRAFWFPYAVQFMLRTNQLGPRDSVDGFFVETNGLEARFKVPIQLQFDVGTTGYTDVQSQPKDSDFCKAHDSQQARRRMLGVAATPAAYGDEVLEHKLVDGELLPVIRAAPMRM